MGAPRARVRVTRRGPTAQSDREALLAFAAHVTGSDPSSTILGRRCPHCRGTDHGRPWAVASGRPVGVSLARTPDVLALAVAPGPVGIDIERRSRVVTAPLDVQSPGERARYGDDPDALAACWAATEAVLKRDGRGLRVEPALVDVDLQAGVAHLDGTGHPMMVRWLDDDLVLAVSVDGPVVVDDARARS
ncbi:4'-phosphopantetheinyl transferase superfamily protein [Curtobacterium sp. VKM Ac-2922]|uniref:4'-phosphopantetheinyl transferase family protein n=1 Tax=Curtobacterium sp. VKM Ac-2922 TaxID=2929475 RepID=UPI001FB1E6F3|nr:4'-phosphopantetheinyl transferase superfamily protein [Curtobacterium sp. VKM Ac-2922]MCJ1713766.1 4'-phosphopantetheinyl transferase superfamily protein [Curtobacterium sp. VKM Ac-2922]